MSISTLDSGDSFSFSDFGISIFAKTVGSKTFYTTVGSDSPFISDSACSIVIPRALALASADLINKCSGISTMIYVYSGPEIPPSFLTLQK